MTVLRVAETLPPVYELSDGSTVNGEMTDKEMIDRILHFSQRWWYKNSYCSHGSRPKPWTQRISWLDSEDKRKDTFEPVVYGSYPTFVALCKQMSSRQVIPLSFSQKIDRETKNMSRVNELYWRTLMEKWGVQRTNIECCRMHAEWEEGEEEEEEKEGSVQRTHSIGRRLVP